MQYLALLCGNETVAQPGPDLEAELGAYRAFGQKYADAIRAGDALGRSATTVRHRDGEPLVVDGPYAETAEGVGGYYVLEAPSLDEAIEMAAQIPAARKRAIELRPVVTWVDNSPAEHGRSPAGTARYVAFIRGQETDADIPGTPAWDAGAERHRAFMEAAGADVWAGVAVQPTSASTTVRSRDGEVLVTDGPFAEVSEVVGGAYAFGPVTKDRAVELAALVPAEAVELVPVMEFG
jgi:hypothetical protein